MARSQRRRINRNQPRAPKREHAWCASAVWELTEAQARELAQDVQHLDETQIADVLAAKLDTIDPIVALSCSTCGGLWADVRDLPCFTKEDLVR